MSEINSIEAESETTEEKLEVNYEATPEDEQKFILMYGMHMTLTEVDGLEPERRKWFVARFIMQKEQEHAQRQTAQIAQQLSQGGGIIR